MATAERVFRPRFTVAVCVFLALAFVAGAVILLVTLAGLEGDHSADRFTIILIALIATVTASLVGRPRAVASASGLAVRNPIRSRQLSWEEIVAVRFGRSDPWVLLDLDDGTTYAVLAIQASDGSRARRDAAWLRNRVAEHEGEEPSPGS